MLPYTKSLVVTEISMFLEHEVLLVQTKIEQCNKNKI